MGGPDAGSRRARLLLAGGCAAGDGSAGDGVTGAGAVGRGRPVPGGRIVALGGAVRRFAGRVGRQWLCLPVGGVLAVLAESVLPLLAAVAAVPLLGRWLRRRERRRAAERREGAVIELCAGVAAELRAGQQPERALLASGAGGLGQAGSAVLAAARFGGDVPGALRRAAREPGAGGLAGVAACWQVAVDGGAGLADGLDRVADALRAEREQREELRAQLAGPRSTALVLALLPLFGLLLGTAMGAEPLRVLLHSPVGWGVLAAAGLLEWAGLAWVAQIVRAAEGAKAA
ncbi:type II secretion system F family protein [Streptomyces gobiensis]|uniref:type II secretion system F family protein n=1 Tax=Streptomyces gobiensis TaxID=2875706 RepID=UPI001E454626|nr:type II secretion system F family protein [Streptomyces gobiensis]UGY95116.1 type II secretion system F family protein [Streptomyces gobiensis]